MLIIKCLFNLRIAAHMSLVVDTIKVKVCVLSATGSRMHIITY